MSIAFDTDGMAQASRELARAHLRLVYPELVDRLPSDVRQAVEAMFRQLERRAVKPVLEAHSRPAAQQLASEGFVAFCELWPGVLGLLVPYFAQADVGTMRRGRASDTWNSPTALRRFGALACANFEGAQLARARLARLALRLIARNGTTPELEEENVIRAVMTADFALLLGMRAVTIRRPPPFPATAATWLSEVALENARSAFTTVATPFYRAADEAAAHAEKH